MEHGPQTKDELLNLAYGDITIGEKVTEQVGVIGEKIELADYAILSADQVAPYIHMGNKAGVLVGLNKGGEDVFNAGRDVAMQVAAMKPIALDQNDVDQSVIEKEIEIGNGGCSSGRQTRRNA